MFWGNLFNVLSDYAMLNMLDVTNIGYCDIVIVHRFNAQWW